MSESQTSRPLLLEGSALSEISKEEGEEEIPTSETLVDLSGYLAGDERVIVTSEDEEYSIWSDETAVQGVSESLEQDESGDTRPDQGADDLAGIWADSEDIDEALSGSAQMAEEGEQSDNEDAIDGGADGGGVGNLKRKRVHALARYARPRVRE